MAGSLLAYSRRFLHAQRHRPHRRHSHCCRRERATRRHASLIAAIPHSGRGCPAGQRRDVLPQRHHDRELSRRGPAHPPAMAAAGRERRRHSDRYDHRRPFRHFQRRFRHERDPAVGTRRDSRDGHRRHRRVRREGAADGHLAHLDSAARERRNDVAVAAVDRRHRHRQLRSFHPRRPPRCAVPNERRHREPQQRRAVVSGGRLRLVRDGASIYRRSAAFDGSRRRDRPGQHHTVADPGAERDHDSANGVVRGVCVFRRQRHGRRLVDARLEFACAVPLTRRVLGSKQINFGAPMRRLLAFSLCLLCTSAFAIDPPREKERWTTLTIDELTVYSSADDGTTRSIASDLVRLRSALSVVTKLKVRSPLPTRVFIFRDRKTFEQYCEAAIARSDNLSGVFLSDRDGNHVLIAGSSSGIDHVVYHELTHYFLKNTVSSEVPLWFNEGLAEFYSTFHASKYSVDVGLPVDAHLAWLREQPLIPLKDLFAIDHNSKEYHEGNRQGVFYAESWALVHYMMIGNPERRSQLGTYIGLIASGKPIDDAFRGAFHCSFDDLERELRKYIRAFSMSYIRYSVADLNAVEVPAPRPLPRDTQLIALADLLMHGNAPHFSEAETFLTAALKANPSSAEAYAELGVAKSWQRQNAEAETAFDKAVQLGSRDAQPYILYGDSILRRVETSVRNSAGAPSADVIKARELFRKATELNPSSAPAFSGLGATYAMTQADDPLPGIAALERSLALAPAEVDANFNVILLEARAGRREEAAKHLEALSRIADAETVRQARENLYIADLKHANDLLRAGKHADGAEIMKRVAAETTNEQLKAQLDEQLTSVGHVAAANHQISEFQRAVNKANNGKFKEALAMIDALLPTITEPELLSAAKDFRAKVTEYIAATTPRKKKSK